MDELHRHLFTMLMDREWKHGVPAAVDVMLLGRFYERFADHTVEIARRVIFQHKTVSRRRRPANLDIASDARRQRRGHGIDARHLELAV
jgi:phosphate uptake regulator